jgi:hypothetical protein
MILLVGEQPLPNLLPTRHLKPNPAVLVYTDRTRRIAENLEGLLDCQCLPCPVSPYNIPEIQDEVHEFLSERLPDYAFTFNLTGGTKPMALAAFSLARSYNAPFVYFQTEGNHSRLYHYAFDENTVYLERVEDLPDTIALDDYLRMYLGRYEVGEPRNELECQVRETLRAKSDLEVLWSLRPQGLEALEVDFVVRLGNQVGVGEVKTKGAKSGIDQINAVAEQRYLGTYVWKFLISGKPMDGNNRNLAQAYRIEVIELPTYDETGLLDTRDREKLIETIVTRLGGQV